MTTNTGTAILNRLIEPDHDDLPPETAQYLLGLDFSKKDHTRVAKLSGKASEGTLKPDEREELDEYLRVADLLALLQSKARLSLKNAGLGSRDAWIKSSNAGFAGVRMTAANTVTCRRPHTVSDFPSITPLL